MIIERVLDDEEVGDNAHAAQPIAVSNTVGHLWRTRVVSPFRVGRRRVYVVTLASVKSACGA